MTDRINGFWVALDQEYRVDDAQAIIGAVKQLKGVIAVKAKVTDSSKWFIQEQIRQELGKKILDILYPPKD